MYPALGNHSFQQISLHRNLANVGENKTSHGMKPIQEG